MGVPAFFRWLSRKYPKIMSPVVEETADAQYGGPQYSDPNPNGEIDNLYLDMNGIVHPCSHPEHKPAPETEDEMLLDIFQYTDRVLMMARPRKVLMLAVDGVAPRAKMNQQRSRRFRSAQDAKISHEEKQRQIRELELKGEVIDDSIKGKKSWDSNAITPGTPFMDKLATALRYWVSYKLASDPGWANLNVIISDASVPGEGEHKLMKFIRLQRLDPEHDPNTKHCIYGLDADLIFLGLSTHEPHFRVLREDVFANQSRSMKISDQLLITQEQKDALKEQDGKKPFLWLHVNVLREYLEVELFNPHLPFSFDLERAIDDWVFMCFFVGNDFLPHLPSLDVRDNGIDILVGCWKRILPKLKGYVTRDGNLNLDGVEELLRALAYKEDEIFRKRHENEERREENNKRRMLNDTRAPKRQNMLHLSKGSDRAPLTADMAMPLLTTSGENVRGFSEMSNKEIVANRAQPTMSNLDAAASLKKLLDSKNNTELNGDTTEDTESNSIAVETADSKKRTIDEVSDETTPQPDENGDNVRMWEPGYRKRYYKTKFHLSTDEEVEEHRKSLVKYYLEGISWVLLYYYQGCPSWQWYYPYHYSPFAADFKNIKDIVGEEGITFKLGQPFKPYEQLMSVLPAASGHNLPEVFRALMSDPSSEIIDFYPEEFQIDMNGKKMSWQGIALLPFIDENRLIEAVLAKYPLLTEYERERNTHKEDILFISSKNKNYKKFYDALYDSENHELIFRSSSIGLAGYASNIESFKREGKTPFPLKEGDMEDLENTDFLPMIYQSPPSGGKSMLLTGYIPHVKALTQEDKDAIIYGQGRGGGPRFRNASDNRDYINAGPSGKELFLTYGMRRGGYRSFIEMTKSGLQNQYHKPNYAKSNSRFQNGRQSGYQNNYRNGYNNGGGYNNGNYGQGYNSYNNYDNHNGYRSNGGYNGNFSGRGPGSLPNRPGGFNNAQYNNNRFRNSNQNGSRGYGSQGYGLGQGNGYSNRSGNFNSGFNGYQN